jgi:PqqA peptide cyclase
LPVDIFAALVVAEVAATTDPVCAKSPQHGLIEEALKLAEQVRSGQSSQPIIFRDPKTSRQLNRPF